MPRATFRFYSPHPLNHEGGAMEAAQALSPRRVALVAENAGHEIAGYAWYRWKAEDSRRSTFGICLHPDYRGIGLGQAMIARLLVIAAHVGPPVMSLTVQLANARALALYSKMGFQVVREQVRKQIDEFAAEPEYYMEQPTRRSS
jgi:ribosomal protein S18 acetylase RimI-like enzyme